MEHIKTSCCVVGGGPAGMMLGYLLARAGARVTVLEKHKDFNRDFRGDTVHPSTLEVMRELGLLERFLELPHQKIETLGGVLGDYSFTAGDFRLVPAHCKFVALMPQWDFLDFLANEGRRFAGFDLRMQNEATALLEESERVTGVEARTPTGPVRFETELVVGCDGRHAITRAVARLPLKEFGVPIDVLWFRLSRNPGDPEQVLGYINYGKALVMINRGNYFQCGLIVRKGSFDAVKSEGLDRFRSNLERIAPFVSGRVQELQDWDQVKLLTVQINRLLRWHRPGLLCIGDCAHAMSPAGGVGINLAVQDAIAAANILAEALREHRAHETLLAEVQARRGWPTRMTQALQLRAHRLLEGVFQDSGPARAPWQLRAAVQLPLTRYLMARVVGMGFRPEHVRTAEILSRS